MSEDTEVKQRPLLTNDLDALVLPWHKPPTAGEINEFLGKHNVFNKGDVVLEFVEDPVPHELFTVLHKRKERQALGDPIKLGPIRPIIMPFVLHPPKWVWAVEIKEAAWLQLGCPPFALNVNNSSGAHLLFVSSGKETVYNIKLSYEVEGDLDRYYHCFTLDFAVYEMIAACLRMKHSLMSTCGAVTQNVIKSLEKGVING
jgi:hypothetical protein